MIVLFFYLLPFHCLHHAMMNDLCQDVNLCCLVGNILNIAKTITPVVEGDKMA